MTTFTNRLIAFGAVAVLAIVGSLMYSRPASAQGPSDGVAVRIVQPLPVPVTGNVAVAGPISVNGSVSITGNSASNPLNVRDVDSPARQPYTQSVGSSSCNIAFCFFNFPAVPSGKRLVIQQVNLYVRPASTSTIVDQAEFLTSTGPASDTLAEFHFPMALIGVAGAAIGSNTYGGNLAIVAYAEANTSPRLETANRNNGSANDFGRATISGYLINVP